MPSYLVTGASRGFGLGFVTELLKSKDSMVIATARNISHSSGLSDLKAQDRDGRLLLVELDVSKPESIRAAVEKITGLLPSGLDNLVNNAGVSYNGMKTFEELDIGELTAEMDFTVVATLSVVRGFLPLVRRSEAKRIAVITSVLGSIETAVHMPNLANGYSVARAALNMLARKWSSVLKADGITMALIHPGWTNTTEIGGVITDWMTKYAPHIESSTVEKLAADTVKVLNGLTIEHAGGFFVHDGTKLPF